MQLVPCDEECRMSGNTISYQSMTARTIFDYNSVKSYDSVDTPESQPEENQENGYPPEFFVIKGASGEDYIWSVDHDNDASSDDNIYVVPDKRMDGETDRRLDGQTDGQTDKQTNKDNIFYIQGSEPDTGLLKFQDVAKPNPAAYNPFYPHTKENAAKMNPYATKNDARMNPDAVDSVQRFEAVPAIRAQGEAHGNNKQKNDDADGKIIQNSIVIRRILGLINGLKNQYSAQK